MPEYSPSQRIIDQSLEELKYILQWVRAREGNDENIVTVLIGGWAVDAYNHWYGSIDIDLVTNHTTKSSLMWHLLNNHGYEHYRAHGSHSVAKNTSDGPIIIDFVSRETENPFEGRSETLNSHILDCHTELRNIGGGVPAAVPTRDLLLLFKLNAAWDRAYRLRHGTSEDSTWERGKLIKDCADILALLDPKFGGEDLEIAFLGEQFARFDFLKECLERIPDNYDALAKYEKMDRKTAQQTCEKLLLLLQ